MVVGEGSGGSGASLDLETLSGICRVGAGQWLASSGSVHGKTGADGCAELRSCEWVTAVAGGWSGGPIRAFSPGGAAGAVLTSPPVRWACGSVFVIGEVLSWMKDLLCSLLVYSFQWSLLIGWTGWGGWVSAVGWRLAGRLSAVALRWSRVGSGPCACADVEHRVVAVVDADSCIGAED